MNENLKKYIDLLLHWNERINLIGKSTIQDLENRHVKDSLQLLKYFSEAEKTNASFVDLGTGAGFPGIILSMFGIKNMTLVEKSIQKCNFLKEAVKFSDNSIKIINENIYEIVNVEKYDFMISRALANLSELLEMSSIFCHENTKCIFLKGKKFQEEIDEAKKKFNFNVKIYESETSDEGKVLILEKIFAKKNLSSE